MTAPSSLKCSSQLYHVSSAEVSPMSYPRETCVISTSPPEVAVRLGTERRVQENERAGSFQRASSRSQLNPWETGGLGGGLG